MAVLSMGKGGGAGTGSMSYDFTGGGWRVSPNRPRVVDGRYQPPPPPPPEDGEEGEEEDEIDIIVVGPTWPVLEPPDEVEATDDAGAVIATATLQEEQEAWDASDTAILNESEDGLTVEALDNFSGHYKSYLYEVSYSSDTEASLPRPDSFGTTTEDTDSGDITYMRVHIPQDFFASGNPDWLGVVLFMQGGTSDTGAVADEEFREDEPSRLMRSYLASGLSYPYPLRDPTETTIPYYFRPGPPMIVATFNYPGRGNASRGVQAEGASDFVCDTPSNGTGQDYAGEMTFAATEAVVAVLLEIVEDIRDQWLDSAFSRIYGPLGTNGARLIVCTSSWGLNPAARWIANTSLDVQVHALVDWEGPTDSAEALIVTTDYDPYTPLDTGLPPELTSTVFERWAVGNTKSFPHWFRPPHPLLFADALPTNWSTFVWALARGYDPGRDGRDWWISQSAPIRFVPGLISDMWDERYNDTYSSGDPLHVQLVDFWEPREAITWLADVTAQRTAYVRIQGRDDHNQPLHMLQRHAIKALNAAFSGYPSVSLAYYADEANYWQDANGYLLDTAQPSQVATSFDVANPQPTVVGDWGNEEFWPDVFEGKAWSVQVDLIRWALETTFVS